MDLYCDRLSAGVVLALLTGRIRGVSKVWVLDAPPGRIAPVLLRGIGADVREARFFTGQLRSPDGEAVYVTARRLATPLLFDAVDRLLAASAALSRANDANGRGTIRLFLARFLWPDVEPLVARVLSARALANTAACTVLLPAPVTIDPDVIRTAFPETRIHFHGSVWRYVRSIGLVRRALMNTLGRELRWMLPRRRAASHPGVRAPRPGLLVLQEDDLSLDRSVRSQPHWKFPDTATASFETYVLPRNRSTRLPADERALRQAGITVLDDDFLASARRPRTQTAADRALAAEARGIRRAVLTAASARTKLALIAVWGLLVKARSLAAWCANLDVRAFLTGENYPVESDAMQLVAERTGITTLSYQYSNLPFSTPLMMTTADRLLVFSRTFTPLWTSHGVTPKSILDTGYVFDGAFAVVRPRASEARERLNRAGARFVLCYFDESVQSGKYGLIDEREHREELHALAKALGADPSLGLVVKTQFERNSPSKRYAGDAVFQRALETGRYLELRRGVHRNTVFPCEAAMAADLAIGHIVGATAALEAALAGVRCVLLNPYGMRSLHDDLYARAHIVVPTMADALSAIGRLRAGDGAAAGLGDWSEILPHFDPWRDGRSAVRLRGELERIFASSPEQRIGAA